MNRRHARLTDWGLQHLSIRQHDIILDVGCGGGRTVAKLADVAAKGRAYGIDYAPVSVAAARKFNQRLVDAGRVTIREASVLDLPFPDDTFDLVTAVETHFWWQDLNRGMREVFRVLKPGGRVAVIAEFYNGGRHAKHAALLAKWTGIAALDLRQHETLLADAGFIAVDVDEELSRGWICVLGTKHAPTGE